MKSNAQVHSTGSRKVPPRNCLNCVHHAYEENHEEVEVLVCYRFRRPVRDPETDAAGCHGYHSGNND